MASRRYLSNAVRALSMDAVQKAKITRTALIFVGKGLGMDAAFRDSALYDAAHAHILRPVRGRKTAKT